MFSLSSNHESQIVSAAQSKNYNGIDLIKFFCAILIFIIHIPPFQGNVSVFGKYVNFGLQQYLCRLAVPFYFVSSGFLLFKKMSISQLNTDTIKNYCFKILRLIGIWNVLLFIGGTWHLWYLGATVIAVSLLSLCFHFRIRLRYLCVFACLLYIIGLLGDSYYGVVEPLTNLPVFKYVFKSYHIFFRTTRNGIFMGFIFVLMGALFSCCKISLKLRTALIGLGSSLFCLFAEVFLLQYNDIPADYNMYVFLLPAVFFLFSFAHAIQLKDHIRYRHMRNIGMLIYFSHVLVNQFVSLGIGVIGKYWGGDLTRYQFIASLFFTLLFSVCFEWLSCKDKFKWLSWLLS